MNYLFRYAVHAALVAYPNYRAEDIAEVYHDLAAEVVIVSFDGGEMFYYFY